jgi:dolichyl-phosphate beta-glucosyltransferase
VPAREAPTLSIVIPALNEEDRLPRLLEVLMTSAADTAERAGFSFLEAVIVDDGSTDRTWEVLRAAAAADSRVRPMRGEPRNLGKGAALAAALAATRGEFALQVDVDLATPLEELPKLGSAIRQGADIAIGSRVAWGAVVEGPRHRKLLGWGFNFLVRRITGLPFRDTQCPFKLMRTAVAHELLDEHICPGFAYDVDLLLRARIAGLRVVEAPVNYTHDPSSRVRIAADSRRMFVDVVRMARRIRTERRSPSRAGRAGAA